MFAALRITRYFTNNTELTIKKIVATLRNVHSATTKSGSLSKVLSVGVFHLQCVSTQHVVETRCQSRSSTSSWWRSWGHGRRWCG